jgi:hypothetical protein
MFRGMRARWRLGVRREERSGLVGLVLMVSLLLAVVAVMLLLLLSDSKTARDRLLEGWGMVIDVGGALLVFVRGMRGMRGGCVMFRWEVVGLLGGFFCSCCRMAWEGEELDLRPRIACRARQLERESIPLGLEGAVESGRGLRRGRSQEMAEGRSMALTEDATGRKWVGKAIVV